MPTPVATENTVLLKPTLHVEVIVRKQKQSTKPVDLQGLRRDLHQWFINSHATVKVGQEIILDDDPCLKLVERVDVADYTGPPNTLGYFDTDSVQLDLQAYIFKAESGTEGRRSITQDANGDMPQARVLALPNVLLKDESDSLVFDDGLPSRLLRYLVRMIGMMRQPGLTLATFNWNRLCLLHGPPGSGKSTLCRALAQKLSIRLGQTFPRATLIELNTSSMLSKYFGESGKLISATFERVYAAAQDPGTLICVVMDEVETIAGSRERSTASNECNDGMRATNQLLTALDRLRHLPNVIVLCTSNLISAIDQAFLDRVDIKQLVPSPSPAAIYNILRSCLNELIRSNLVNAPTTTTVQTPEQTWTLLSPPPDLPTLSHVQIHLMDPTQSHSPGYRVWALASQKCAGFSGRTLRRLPILGLAMYTWGGESVTLEEAVAALEAAVEQEVRGMKL
ncbi:hypothetical protein LTS16_001409 [Friedmanniomyces endolithicus]|uniref:AAA+ ATPase domain-containing protein n=2 Tax=Friedmanniomyces endolithicus TaxID=329885 RepID=A0A4V5N8C2_9PEZI|nr:hypothetical protein LTS09_006733 [Friedmanniomyces endolithicus]KAK0315857.1 hypothetical protein LTR01_001157 [Friedmanniomyces endolithicus]KAK0320729.1 hypothetical protein LTR82_008442 [Friedmanniomyces endolithicus]KAK0833693.1 hypothetical protein LTR73_001456 [Friedmanniomyces endolithicus]KAK0928134.1 hypothetical protein LTR57_002868 [Friedmanniomyces endolithicus]